MKMRLVFARFFCLLTVLLLSTNVVLSSISFENPLLLEVTDEEDTSLQFDVFSGPSSPIGFLAEKDPFEDFSSEADIPQLLSFEFYTSQSNNEKQFLFSHYAFLGLKIPRWLWVRHIII